MNPAKVLQKTFSLDKITQFSAVGRSLVEPISRLIWTSRLQDPHEQKQEQTAKLLWVVVSNIFHFHTYLGKIPILTFNIQRGWFNHQLPPQTQVLQADEVGLVLVAMAFSETRSAVLLNANNTRSTLKPVTGVVDISIYTLEGESQKVASDEPIFVTLVEKFLFRGSPGRVGGRVGVVSDNWGYIPNPNHDDK